MSISLRTRYSRAPRLICLVFMACALLGMSVHAQDYESTVVQGLDDVVQQDFQEDIQEEIPDDMPATESGEYESATADEDGMPETSALVGPVPGSESEAGPEAESADTLPPVQPDLIVSAGILVDGLAYDLPMPWGHAEFERLREHYLSTGGKKWLRTVMAKSMLYMGYVEEKIAEYGVPRELLYLPIIESEYSPLAVSRSGATGIWQFMRNSTAGYGLSITDWKDDRKDFMKSTDAALRKLRDNHKVLGDWLLAISAYNAGLGAVTKAIKSSPGEDIEFWHLYEAKKLSREATAYVPKLLAIASILRYPDMHGITPDWGEYQRWSAVETGRQVDLSVLSENAGISLDLLRKGNAELRYSVTPPVQAHLLKVPSDKAEDVKGIIADTSKKLFKYDIYKVKSGDTLGAIAGRYGTPIDIIVQANPGLKPDRIGIGQVIIIPHLKSTVAAPAKAAPGNSGAAASFENQYTVKKGDTFWQISKTFGISPELLAEKNGLGLHSTLRIGQKLMVP